jgi:hypothetical protein
MDTVGQKMSVFGLDGNLEQEVKTAGVRSKVIVK